MSVPRAAWSSFRASQISSFRSAPSRRVCPSCLRSNSSTGASRTASTRLPADEYKQRWLYLQISVGSLLFGSLVYGMTSGKTIANDSPPVQPVSLAQVDDYTKSREQITRKSPMRLRMEALIKEHQNRIVFALENIDGHKFRRDEWKRPAGGSGISCVLQDGNVFEKAGVLVSVVYGELPRPAIEKMLADHKSFVASDVEKLNFFAAGISLVLHPHNPMAPTVHMNYRYFETSDPRDPVNATGTSQQNWWFGGGTDLTPCYLFEEDAQHFHKTIKAACDKHDKNYYPRFKKWCDTYFTIPHRQESRGIGGIFFDDLTANSRPNSRNPQEELFQFVASSLESFLPSYLPIVKKRMDMPYLPQQKEWQQIRRGRYVEFNLIHDRGTSFGLRTPGARVESILASLPLTARWEYMNPVCGTGIPADPEDGEDPQYEKERELMEVLKHPKEWL